MWAYLGIFTIHFDISLRMFLNMNLYPVIGPYLGFSKCLNDLVCSTEKCHKSALRLKLKIKSYILLKRRLRCLIKKINFQAKNFFAIKSVLSSILIFSIILGSLINRCLASCSPPVINACVIKLISLHRIQAQIKQCWKQHCACTFWFTFITQTEDQFVYQTSIKMFIRTMLLNAKWRRIFDNRQFLWNLRGKVNTELTLQTKHRDYEPSTIRIITLQRHNGKCWY